MTEPGLTPRDGFESAPVEPRRAERAFHDWPTIADILRRADLGHLGLVDAAGPYVVPISYGVVARAEAITVYLHGAPEGRKLAALTADPRVCFEVALRQSLAGVAGSVCDLTVYYDSVIGFGRGRVVTDPDERRAGLAAIVDHYQPGRGPEVPDPVPARVAVLALDLTAWSGKSHPAPLSGDPDEPDPLVD